MEKPPQPALNATLATFWAETPTSELRTHLWQFEPGAMLEDLGLQPDPWQVEFLKAKPRRALLNCSRRSGKTTVAAADALLTAMFSPRPALVLIFAPAGKQSDELLYTLQTMYQRLGKPVPRETDKVSILDFDNGSRILPMTMAPDSSVGYTPDLIIVDEAARVPEELFKGISPMLALKTRPCRLICLSTPHGKSGYFYREWTEPKATWQRVRITSDQCPRLDPEVIEADRLSFGDGYVRQEYGCSFESMAGLVYPDYEACIMDPFPLTVHRAWAGVDFGWNNPSAFEIVASDADDVLYVVDEIYGSRMTDEELARRGVEKKQRWPLERVFCDAAAPQSIEKLRRAGLPALPAHKAVADGIRAVGARMRTGRLKIFRTCTELIRELGLYHYDPERPLQVDAPVKEHDHAPDALRYLVMGIDRGKRPHGQEPPADIPEPVKVEECPDPDGDYRKPVPQTRYKKRPAQPRETAEEREANAAHMEHYGWTAH